MVEWLEPRLKKIIEMANTVSDYLNAKFIRIGIELSGVEIAALQLTQMQGTSFTDAMTADNIAIADKACLFHVKDLLLLPDISEGGYSSKIDKTAVEKWYNTEVQRLGLSNDKNFSLAPKIRDASNRW